jgi:SAM-dependent methyltransferase
MGTGLATQNTRKSAIFWHFCIRRPEETLLRRPGDRWATQVNALFVYYFQMIRTVLALAVSALLSLPQSLAPFVPSPEDVVDRMLQLAAVTKADTVLDLGCGDGRIPIRAAQKYGARGIGVDIDPQLVELAQGNARKAGVDQLVDFRLEDAMTTDLSQASVVTLYLLSSSNAKLRPRLRAQLKPGARIVSHAFSMGTDWPADTIDRFTSARGDEVTLYLWKIR